MEDLPAFVLAGIALTGSPGPATLSLAATGAAFGARRGLGYLAGIVAGVLVVMAITASGVTGLVMALPGAAPVVAALAAAYVVWLAWRIATAPPLADASRHGRPPRPAAASCWHSPIPRPMRRWRRCSRATYWCARGRNGTLP